MISTIIPKAENINNIKKQIQNESDIKEQQISLNDRIIETNGTGKSNLVFNI